MDTLINSIANIENNNKLFMMCGILIFADILTGYLKALKLKKFNSSISRDGYIKKVTWIIALLLGLVIDIILEIKIFLIGSAIACISTEGISIYENLGEIGLNLPFKAYFEKLKNINKE